MNFYLQTLLALPTPPLPVATIKTCIAKMQAHV
jgi:hypothetical protein